MAVIREDFGTGGANMVPRGAQGEPTLPVVLRDVADDLAALKPAQVTTPDAGGTYTANEQALLNELKTVINALYAVGLLTTKG